MDVLRTWRRYCS